MASERYDDRLLELPLFQGFSVSDLKDVVANIKLRKIDVSKGKTIVDEGDPCRDIYIVCQGYVTAVSYADDKGYSISEQLTAPCLVQPERLFGFTQRYNRQFIAGNNCQLLCIPKADVVILTNNFEIFRLNLLNIICTQTQRLTHIPWRVGAQTIREKIFRFLETRCLRPAGEKQLCIKMERLATEIHESRLNVSKELNALATQGLIVLKRSSIYVVALERLKE